jgi:hypothetical protein
MSLTRSGRDAGGRHDRAHGAAMIGAVKQELRHELGIVCCAVRTQTGQIGSLGQAGKHHQITIIVSPQAACRLQAAQRWVGLLMIDFGIALIRGNNETVAVRQLK